jgi:TatD DNase family protein
MPRLIDTHCHLARGRLAQDPQGVLDRARQAGVKTVLCATSDLGESQAAVALVDRLDGLYCLAGIHPHDAKDADAQSLEQIEILAGHEKNVAIGEIGLDYHYDYSPRQAQREAFAAQIELARRLGKRVVVHTREAFQDTLSVLRESGIDGSDVLFHSFTGDGDQARRILDLGARISYGGIVTFKKSRENREAAMLTPPDRICVETDAPFLTPEPIRKIRTNEPAHVVHTARLLAEIRKQPLEEFASRTTANAEAFFGIQGALPEPA